MRHRIVRAAALLLALALCAGMLPAEAADRAGEAAPLLAAQSRYYNFKTGDWTGADNQKLLQAARAQVGLFGYDLGYTEPWSAAFVCDAARLAGVASSVIDWSAGDTVPGLYARLKAQGAKEVALTEARTGDIVFLDWDRNDADGPVADGLDHAAIVAHYDSSTRDLSYVGGYRGDKEGSIRREVTEELLDTSKTPSVSYVLRPGYATADDAVPKHLVRVSANVVGSGTVTGTGSCMQDTNVTLTAVPGAHARFAGWYGSSGKLLSDSARCTFAIKDNTTVTARFEDVVTVTVTASRSGAARGSGVYPKGEPVTATAVWDSEERSFSGWYDRWGNLLSRNVEYTWTPAADAVLYALFEGDVFADIPANAWYLSDVMEAVERGLTNGATAVTFEGGEAYTRAMAAVMLQRLDQSAVPETPETTPETPTDGETAETVAAPETSEDTPEASPGTETPEAPAGDEPDGEPASEPSEPPVSPFPDVAADAWYGPAVLWAHGAGVVNGREDGTFGPNVSITRQDFFTMAVRYLNSLGYSGSDSADLPYGDAASIVDYARKPIAQAQAMGLIKGDDNGLLRPTAVLTRSEGATFMVRIARYLESHGPKTPVEITYDPNGGSFDGSTEPLVSTSPSPYFSPEPAREGYAFLGWFTEQEGGAQVTAKAASELTGSVTLYAHWRADGEEPAEPAEPVEPVEPSEPEEEMAYVLNTYTMKFHLADCESIDKIPRDHMERITATRSAIIAQGYTPCDYCKP